MRSTLKCDIISTSSGGFISMKTKIIYISGNEVFDMTDIRAAFEEVRNTLGLGADTVLFGVPVDSDDALVSSAPQTTSNDEARTEPATVIAESEEIIDTDFVEEPVVEVPQEKKPKKASAKKSREIAEKKEEKTVEVKETIENQPEEILNNTSEEKIIPILSVLATKKEEPEEVHPETTEQNNTNITKDTFSETEPVVQEEIQSVTIEDMINDEAPSEPIEKTLEQLLESMTPLREDMPEEHISETEDEAVTEEQEEPVINMEDETATDNTDATLEQLAAEFAETEDTIPVAPQTENHSKIGKLKNILPFKKAKREDTGLMGDLFGWAGIAANDDDFTMPGFFTNAASKK